LRKNDFTHFRIHRGFNSLWLAFIPAVNLRTIAGNAGRPDSISHTLPRLIRWRTEVSRGFAGQFRMFIFIPEDRLNLFAKKPDFFTVLD
jgi:hypothetical protein